MSPIYLSVYLSFCLPIYLSYVFTYLYTCILLVLCLWRTRADTCEPVFHVCLHVCPRLLPVCVHTWTGPLHSLPVAKSFSQLCSPFIPWLPRVLPWTPWSGGSLPPELESCRVQALTLALLLTGFIPQALDPCVLGSHHLSPPWTATHRKRTVSVAGARCSVPRAQNSARQLGGDGSSCVNLGATDAPV